MHLSQMMNHLNSMKSYTFNRLICLHGLFCSDLEGLSHLYDLFCSELDGLISLHDLFCSNHNGLLCSIWNEFLHLLIFIKFNLSLAIYLCIIYLLFIYVIYRYYLSMYYIVFQAIPNFNNHDENELVQIHISFVSPAGLTLV